MTIINLDSKASYVASIQKWKEEYKAITKEIREVKKFLSQPHEIVMVETSKGSYNCGSTAEFRNAQYKKLVLRHRAHALLEERAEGKRLSWELRQKNKQEA